jgi:KDO2-lipid IV(A) lauroyltransferase
MTPNTEIKDKTNRKTKFSFGQKVGMWFGALALRILLLFLGIVPKRLFSRLGQGVGLAMFHFMPRLKRTGIANIKKAFGSKFPDPKAKALIKANLKNISHNILASSSFYYAANPQAFFDKNIFVQGGEHLEDALERGRGVFAVSAHMGSFPLIGAKMAAMGYPCWMLYKDLENIYLKNLYKLWMHNLGVRIIPSKPRRLSASESLKVLRKNGVILLFVDQNPRKKYGVYVQFFGYEVPTYSGPVVMALKTGAAIVPMHIHRNDDDTQTITIQPELNLTKSGDSSQDVTENLRAITVIYEDWIKKYPDQWWWIHRRFRRARRIGEP